MGLSQENVVAEDRLVKQAKDAVANLKADYQKLIMNDMAALRELLGQLRNVDNPSDVVQRIFEITHNVKGQAGSFGYTLVTNIGSSLCDFLRAGDHTDAKSIAIVDHHVTSLISVIEKNIEGDGGESGQKLVSKLHALYASD